jgi:adenylosuccinate lyase
MLGRTHGQPGAPITFGFKTSVWAAEVRRHIHRCAQVRQRLGVVQLAGAVGVGGGLGHHAQAVRKTFAELLELEAPEAAWLNARDRLTEFACLCAMASGTLAKMGNEIRELQRPEVGEVAETIPPGTIGSITMPHKRNPERAEHLGTLARVVRSCAHTALDAVVHQHERDGDAWKIEWWLLPECCMATLSATAHARAMIDGLRVNPDRMRQNLDATGGYVLSEAVMMRLAQRIGKHRAHEAIYAASMRGLNNGAAFRDAVEGVATTHGISGPELDVLLSPEASLPAAAVDQTLSVLSRERGKDASWMTT